MIGLGRLVRAFYIFLVLPTPRSVLGPGLSLLLVCLLFFRPADPPHSVRGHGLGNRAAKKRHGTSFPGSLFLCRPADALLSTEPGGRPG